MYSPLHGHRAIILLTLLALGVLPHADVHAESQGAAPEAPPRLAGAYALEEAFLRDELRLAFAYVSFDDSQVYATSLTPPDRNEYAFLLHLGGRLRLGKRFEVGALLPVMTTRTMPQGGGMLGPGADEVHGLGNVTLMLKLALKNWARFRLAAYLHGVLPTFVRYEDYEYGEDFLSAGAIRPGLSLSGSSGRFSGHLDAGLLFAIHSFSGSPHPAVEFDTRLLTYLLLGGTAAIRVTPSLSLLTAVQLRLRLTDSLDAHQFNNSLIDVWSEDRTYLAFTAAGRLHRGPFALDLGVRWAPVTHTSAREDFSLSVALSYQFGGPVETSDPSS